MLSGISNSCTRFALPSSAYSFESLQHVSSQPDNVHYRYFIQTGTLLINPLLFGFPAFLIFFLVFFCTVNCPNFGRSGMPLYCLLASSLAFLSSFDFLFWSQSSTTPSAASCVICLLRSSGNLLVSVLFMLDLNLCGASFYHNGTCHFVLQDTLVYSPECVIFCVQLQHSWGLSCTSQKVFVEIELRLQLL